MTADIRRPGQFPCWVPAAVGLYLLHTEEGVPLRTLARQVGCHPSTVLRQVRRFENRRDDPLIDEALSRLGRARTAAPAAAASDSGPSATTPNKDTPDMMARLRPLTDEDRIQREALRILRRLCESGTLLAIAPEMPRAVILKETADGGTARIAVLDREVAQVFALKDWIVCRRAGRVATYGITPAGRAALKRMLAEQADHTGLAEAPAPFAAQHREMAERTLHHADGPDERLRVNVAESPAAMLSRRKGADGKPFLSADLLAAAERLREDFELAQIGPRVAQNWDRFLTAGGRGGFSGRGPADGPRDARERVAAALRDLGPGLGDVALRCCCFLEGLEATERRMGWSARSGKIVLRIALVRLRRHYDETAGGRGPMIG
ncbi:DUF6456 domain-containing protein [Rhodobaculum claviforme]|uniref:Helix-turn-helix domain containing protein n=1 Tax=Rhodobaculum claviforme TaxID=1549854 RepID=A0A934TIU1_9RHOB|nr:DUF6456 domain-containing protein [Rhodobaculum claviforme]MBK5925992.1 helix-turn-helix domain containing protein [Rhodobaculum claviforme]